MKSTCISRDMVTIAEGYKVNTSSIHLEIGKILE